MYLAERSGRKRYTYVPKANIKQIYKYFKNSRVKEKRKAFQIPYHFTEARADVTKFHLDADEATEEKKAEYIEKLDKIKKELEA